MIFGLWHRAAGHQDQDRRRRSSARCSTCPTWHRRWPPRWPSRSCSTRHRPGQRHPGQARPARAGLVQRPGLVQAGADPARAVGHRRPDGDLHGRAARRARRSSTRRPSSTAPAPGSGSATSRCPTSRRSSLFAVVTGVIQTMQYYTQPLVAGKVASGVIGGSGQQFEPGYPDKSTLTLPQLVYNLGFQRFDTGSALRGRAGAVRAVHGCSPCVLMRRSSGLAGGVPDVGASDARRADLRRRRVRTSDAEAASRPAGSRAWSGSPCTRRRRGRRCSSCCRSSSSL